MNRTAHPLALALGLAPLAAPAQAASTLPNLRVNGVDARHGFDNATPSGWPLGNRTADGRTAFPTQ